jgi:phosphohistidine phosphatase
MKNLLLIRHAKSSWDDASLSDRERPLNKRGKRDAPYMGKLLWKTGFQPDVVLSSPAKRALKTAKLIAEEIDYPKKKIDIREDIYAQGVEALLEIVAGLDDDWERVALVGHNPALTDLANRLSGAEIDNIPTCGLVLVEFVRPHWGDCAREGGALAWFERPPKTKPETVAGA